MHQPGLTVDSRATRSRWNGWKGTARKILGADNWSEHAETFLRKLFDAGDKPAEAVKTWQKERGDTAAKLNPPPLTPATFGDGSYTAADFRDGISMASIKSGGLVRRVFVDKAGAYWAAVEVCKASGEPGGIPRGVERVTMRRLVAPAHWKPDGRKLPPYVGEEVRDCSEPPVRWFIGRESLEVDVPVEEEVGS